MTDEPLSDRDKAFIRKYGLHCWTRAIKLNPSEIPLLRGRSDQERSFLRDYGSSCLKRAIKLRSLSAESTPPLGEKADPDKVYKYSLSERMPRDDMPSPFGFRKELA